MGLFTLTLAGAGFILIGAHEFLKNPKKNQSLLYMGTSFFSILFIIDSLISLFSSINSKDPIGSALQLQILAIAALFLLYSVLSLASAFSGSVHFPNSILELVLLFAFIEEFLLYYLQRKDTSGIENRYFDLILVPISICVVSTVLELKSSSDNARMARGIGLVLQGTWFVQMGISFYSDMIVHGCALHEKSRGDYTVKCKGHPEYHRARGIATLQFNCHLALLVVLVMVAYSIVGNKNGDGDDSVRYRPLGAEMLQMENNGHFSLDSDEDEIREEENGSKEKLARVENGVNGYSSHE
ncbi:uncharacterized protein LOC126681537 [Mercurialis annua]|uniref:uncharacterized protein LOC126681537 n=1 Tax=Mercurialis annua TaxID=3986 RepID=UPI0021605E18|nr:uncharacterized protein LOC126681537 [Mercurialis annua]